MSVQAIADAWKHSKLEGAQLVVHLAIADVVNDMNENRFWMAQRQLSEKARCSLRTVNTVIGILVDQGFLEMLGPERKGRPNEYRYHPGGVQILRTPEEGAQSVRGGTQTSAIPPSSIPREPKGATKLADPFSVDPTMEAWVKKECPHIDWILETKRFCNHFRGEGKAKKDWTATWKNWMLRAEGQLPPWAKR